MKLFSKKLFFLFIFALIIRLLFDFYFQKFYFGHFVFKYGDSASYINPILNLIHHGTYAVNLNIEDSKYFRVPVYPTFLGIIYLLLGSTYFDYGVAISQAVIDSFSTILVYLMINKILKSSKIAFISAFIYATYPFVIVWNPISYTEILQIFLMFIFLNISLQKDTFLKYFLQGLLISLLVLTKQYLGLLIFIPIITYLFDKNSLKKKVIAISVVIVSFMCTLSPWVIRNYIVSNGKIIILRAKSTGFKIYGKDFDAFAKFASLFNENITPIWDKLSYKGQVDLGNKHKNFVKKHKKQIEKAFHDAYKCGPSFIRRRRRITADDKLCEKEVIAQFNKLTKEFWSETPLMEILETRFESFKKIFFKHNIVNKKIKYSKQKILKTILFYYRTILLFLGIFSIIYLLFNKNQKNKNFLLSILITTFIFYIYFSIILVHSEIRYLLVPDLLILIFAPILIIKIMEYFKEMN